MADLVGQIQRDIEKRLAELRPLIEEKEQLEAVLAALTNGGTAAAPPPPLHHERAPRRPGPPARAPYAAGKGRRAPRGANREAILGVVRERPGVSAAEVAAITRDRQADGPHDDLAAQAQGHPRTRGVRRRQARQRRVGRGSRTGRARPPARSMRVLGLEPSPPD